MTGPPAAPDPSQGRREAYLAAYAERFGRRPHHLPEYVPDEALEAPMTLNLVVPIAVPAAEVANLNDARREHWAVKSRKANALRARGRLAMRLMGSPVLPAAHCVVHVFYPDHRKRDVANLAPTAKALVDGMVSAGLLPDDDDAHLSGPHLVHLHEDVTPPGALWDLPSRAKPFLFVFTFTPPVVLA